MKKSANLDLHAYFSSKDSEEDYSDSLFESNGSTENGNNNDFFGKATIEMQSKRFQVRNFQQTKKSKLPPQDDNDYDLSMLNTPLIPQNERILQAVDAIFLIVASPILFPSTDSDYLRGKPLIYTWNDLSCILSNTFSQYIQSYFREQYGKFRNRLRFYSKISNLNTIRKDVQGGRILFHYIGFGFPPINESLIYTYDQKSNSYSPFSLKELFENLKTPSWLIFDCSNAGSVLNTLESTATENANLPPDRQDNEKYVRPIDWKDYFCVCATDVNEELPIDPHLPRDFLTSCIFSPVRLAVICHIIQYYRTTIVDDNFPLSQINNSLFQEGSTIHSALEKTLDAITDAIAVDSLPADIFQLLFRKDRLTMIIFQRFLLAQYLLKPFQIHPKSNPALPDLSPHGLWQHWRTIIDMQVSSILSPKPSFATDFFIRANNSFRGFIERKEENLISPALLMLLFHIPEDAPYRNESFVLLAEFASTSENARNLLSRTALFNPIFQSLIRFGVSKTNSIELSDSFSIDLDDKENFDLKVFHSLLYLVISLLENSPQFVNGIKTEFDVSCFTQRLFDESMPMYTRTLVAVVIAAVLPHLEGIRSIAVSHNFLVSLQHLLEKSDAPLTLWALIIQRRMFDSFGSELKSFFSISLHIQVASFALHSSPEVRAAALATIPCFLEANSDLSNAQLFGLTMLTAFDASFLVRFNFVLFLSRFLTIYQDKIYGQKPLGKFSHQCFRAILGEWIGKEKPFEVLVSDFSAISEVVDSICESENFLSTFVQIALFLIDYLVDDPHPSIKSSALELKNFVQMQNESSQKKSVQPNINSIIDPHNEFFSADFQTPIFNEFLSAPKERPALCESGGDALYKVCIRQIVAAGCSLDLQTENEDKPVISALPIPLVTQMPSTKVVLKSKTKIDCGRPTVCSYNPRSLSLAVGTSTGNVIYQCEEDNSLASSSNGNSPLLSTSILQSSSIAPIISAPAPGSLTNNLSISSNTANSINSGMGNISMFNYSANSSVSNNTDNNTYIINDESGLNSGNSTNQNKGKFFCYKFSEKVTSLSVTDWPDYSEVLLVGTGDGNAYVWEPKTHSHPVACFRADSPSNCESMPLLLAPQQPFKVLAARGDNGTVRLWDVSAQRAIGEWDAGANKTATALTISPTDPNVCAVGFLNGLIVIIDLRIPPSCGPTNVDAPRAKQTIIRIVGKRCEPTLFWAATSEGSLMKWENLNNLEVVQEGQPLTDFDAHQTSPMVLLSPPSASPYIADTDMKVIHQMKNVEHGSACSFHPALPVVAFASPSGEVLQYELISCK